MSSFDRQRTTPFTTKRPATKVAGKQGAPVAHLVGEDLRCTPLDPVSSESTRREREQLGRKAPLLETYAPNLDIAEGDVLVVGGRDYPIWRVEAWDWHGTPYLRLLVEGL